jgi:hypothetical protein
LVTIAHRALHFLTTHTALIAPAVLLLVGVLLVAMPRRTLTLVLLLALDLHFRVVPVPHLIRHQVALEDGSATTHAIACRIGELGGSTAVCPPIVLPAGFHGPLRIHP